MTNGGREFSAKTVEEAIDIALAQLGVTQDEVNIEVINKGSRGILGFGSEPALVRVSLKPVPPRPADAATAGATQPPSTPPTADAEITAPASAEPVNTETSRETVGVPTTDDEPEAQGPVTVSDDELAEMASEMLAKLVKLMGFEAEIEASWQEPDEEDNQPYLLLDIQGQELGALIGRRGETLASLQYLLRLMVNQRLRQWKNIVVDVEQYKRRRVTQLTQLAERMAQQVVDTGRSVTLEPMPANERRIVHLTLRDHPQVFTESIGEDERRKVSIMPRH